MAPNVSAIVIDNASQDRTVELARRHPQVQVLAHSGNRGFAGAVNHAVDQAVNQGVRNSELEFVLLLNPDARLLTSLDELVQATRQFGLAAGKLAGKTGEAQTGFSIRRFPTPASLLFELFGLNRLWPSNPVNRRYRYLKADLNQPAFVEQPAGAFLMFRRDVWEKLGGLDENFYPIWFEDVDFCRRAVSAGYSIRYVPTVIAEHVGGHSVRKIPDGSRAVYWCDSLLKYASKHFRFCEYRAICLAVVLTSVPRTIPGMIRTRSFSPAWNCIKIIGFAGRRLLTPRRNLGGI